MRRRKPSTQTPAHTFACPACHKAYAWKESFRGNELTCSCGRSFHATPPPVNATFDEPTGPATFMDFKNTATATSPIAAALENREDEYRQSPWVDWYGPIVYLLAGYGVFVFAVFLFMKQAWQAWAILGISTGLGVVVFTPLFLVWLLLIASFFSMPLGRMGPVVLQCLAIMLGGSLISDFIATSILLNIEGLGLYGYAGLIIVYGAYVPTIALPLLAWHDYNGPPAAIAALGVYVAKLAALIPIVLAWPELFK